METEMEVKEMNSKLIKSKKIFFYKIAVIFSLILCISSLIILKIVLNKNEELRVSVKKYQQELAKEQNSIIELEKEINLLKAELKATEKLKDIYYETACHFDQLYYDHKAICPLIKDK